MNKHHTLLKSGKSKEGQFWSTHTQLEHSRRGGARLGKQTLIGPFACLMPDSRSNCLCTSLEVEGEISPDREGNE